jgi:hypothetical protein
MRRRSILAVPSSGPAWTMEQWVYSLLADPVERVVQDRPALLFDLSGS